MKRRDVNEIAFATLQQAIGAMPKDGEQERKADASKAGRKGGLKGGTARAKALTAARRSEIAKKAARSRWNKRKIK